MKNIIISFFLICIASPAFSAGGEESAYDRIMRTQTLRCGYFTRVPMTYKNLETGQIDGIYHDYTEALGKALGLKIEWVEEVGAGDAVTAIQTRRVDAVCSAIWPVSARAVHVDFVRPIFYEPLFLYAKEGDARFDNVDKSKINSPDVSFIAVDGTAPAKIADADFSKAKKIYLPELSPLSDIFVSLSAGKGDLVLAEPFIANDFIKHNPGKIRQVLLGRPLRYAGSGIMIPANEYRLVRMFDLATEELLQTGQIEEILKKHATYKGALLSLALPYVPVE